MREGWFATTLGELCTLTKGHTPTLKATPGEYPLIVTAAEPLSSDTYQFDGEAVCVPMVSSTGHGHASLKRVHYASGKFAVANIITALEAKSGAPVNMRFLWLLLDHGRNEIIVPLMKGTANVSLSQRALAGAGIALPPLAEQRRIVDLIGALDDTIAAAETYRRRADAVLGGVATAVLELPPNAADRRLADVASIIDCEHKTAPASPAGVFAHSIGTGDVRDGLIRTAGAKPISEGTYQEWTARAVPAPGDIILTREAPPGEAGLVTEAHGPLALGQRTVLIKPNEEVLGTYLWALLISSTYRHWMAARNIGQTVKRINLRTIREMPVAFPSRGEQQKRSKLVQEALTLRDRAESTVENLRSLRSNLLSALLSGEHEIPETYDEVLQEAS